MNIAVEELDDDRATVQVDGRLDLVSAGELRRAVEDLLGGGRRRLVVDLGAVPFMDSSGVGALVGGLKLARNAGGELRIAAASTQVREVLRLTTIDRVLKPYDTVDDALATL